MRVAVVGDPMLDRYWIGTANRLSPEAPIPVVKVEKTLELPGGAANVSANLQALGVEVVKFYNPLTEPIKNRLMVDNIQLARWDEHDYCVPYPVSMWSRGDLDAIIVADYCKGGFVSTLVPALQEYHCPIFVDTKGDPTVWTLVPEVVAVFPNQKEYAQYKDEYNQFRLCVLKQGADGISLLSKGQQWLHEPAMAKNVVSVNGAGDTVIAAFVYRYILDGSYESKANRAVRFAARAAAKVVEKPYTSTVTLEEIG